MRINNNISALYAHRQLVNNNLSLAKNIEKLSSGERIVRGRDDAAGLSVSEGMRAQVQGLRQASRNAQDGISLLQSADGFLENIKNVVQRLRVLSVQAANGIYTKENRNNIQAEANQLIDEIDSISQNAEFNGIKILRGGFSIQPENQYDSKGIDPARPYEPEKLATNAMPPVRPVGASDGPPAVDDSLKHGVIRDGKGGGLLLHIGANADQNEKINISNVSSVALGLSKVAGGNEGQQAPAAEGQEGATPTADAAKKNLLLDYLTQDGANTNIKLLDSALFIVNKQRANIGAYQNRLEFTVKGIDNAAENTQAAESKIRDVDMALEMSKFVNNQIKSQSSVAMLSQANLRPQAVLRLLG